MKKIIQELWLVVLLILAASTILLISDGAQRQQADKGENKQYPSIAIMQISATTLLDMHVAGVIDRLQEKGYYAPDGSNIRRFNPMGDFAMANTIAREIVNGPYDIVITSSTVALQVFSKANQTAMKPHVFGAVTDPYGAGVGISGPGADQHPPYMTGVGTFQPVERAFRLFHEMNPRISRVGVVWNPGEQCSEACMHIATTICRELGIELVEAIATNTSEVAEATRSLLSKGVQAIWIGGDTVANSSISLIINLADQAGIPVFTNDPEDAAKGALFGIGGNYFTVGQHTADMAIDILNGTPASSFRIENLVPELFYMNDRVFENLGSGWQLTPRINELLQASRAQQTKYSETIDLANFNQNDKTPSLSVLQSAGVFLNLHSYLGRPAKIALISLVENVSHDEAKKGIAAGLADSGLKPSHDYIIKEYCAQGEVSQLPQIMDAALRDQPDAVITITTPALLAATHKIKETPLIYCIASDPQELGILSGGRPQNLCGVHDNPPIDRVLAMAKNQVSGLSAAGIVYDPSQDNSMISVERLRKAGKSQGVDIVEATASTVSDLPMATQSLIQRGAKAIILSADNLVNTGFPSIHKVAQGAEIPIFTTSLSLIKLGATGGIGYSYYEWGREAGHMAARVLAGIPPANLPLIEAKTFDHKELPALSVDKNRREPFKLRLVQYSDTEFAERCREGLIDGINQAGLIEGRDYVMKTYNAQGDMSTLSSIMTSVKSDRVDILFVISTPSLQAALRQAGEETTIVFSGVGDAVKAGAGKSETDHLPNVTGITTRSSFEGMARIMKESVPGVRRVGTLFTPAELNSVLYKDWFKEALQNEGIELVAIPVTSSADLVQAASELCRQNIQAVGQIVDNMTRPGFTFVARKSAEKNLPVFAFDTDQMKEGAVLCLARDYYDAGIEAAAKAVRILHGESPANIPFNNTQSENLIIHTGLAKKYGLRFSDNLLSKATVIQ